MTLPSMSCFGFGRLLEQRLDLRRKRLQDLYSESAGEVKLRRVFPRHISGYRAEEAVAKEEYKGRSPIHHARADEATAGPETVETVVARARLAAKDERLVVRSMIGGNKTLSGAFFHNVGERIPDRRSDLRREQPHRPVT